MKVTVMTSLLAEGDVYVDSRQLITNLATNLFNDLLEKMHRYILCLIGCVWLNSSSLAQRLFEVEVLGNSELFLPDGLNEMPLQDSVSICRLVQSKIEALKNEGYWLTNLDYIQFKEGKALVKVFIGNKYEFLIIDKSNSEEKQSKKSFLLRLPRRMDRLEFFKLKDQVISQYEDSGFPFVNVRLDSFQLISANLHCQLIVEPGSQINYDSLKLDNKEIVKTSFLSKHLNIPIQEPFNQSEFENISRRIQHLNYLKLDKEPIVYFALQKARVELSLSKQKTNSFDGLIGLVPGTTDRNSDVNGEFNLNLENLFKSGKIFQFHWKKITTLTQQLKVQYEHPYLLGSRLTLDLSYDQLKESTLFSNRQLYVGFKYNLGLDGKLGFFYENKNGNKLEETKSANGDFNLNNYGIEFELNKLNNSIAPRNGYLVTSKASIGLKNIADNSLISNLDNQKKNNQIEFKAGITSYYSFTKKSTLNYRASGAVIENPRLFLNDLYRLGGLMTIRGFNENFFYATQYALSSLEWQLYFEESSYLFLFYDQAFIREQTFTSNRSTNPSGLGLGMRIKSAAGFFNLVYGLGRASGGFSFNQSKIHFGYTGNF